MTDARRPDWGPGGKMLTDGMLAGQARVMGDAAERMLQQARPAARLVLKRIPGLPGLVVDGAEFVRTPNKLRKAASMAGGFVGGAAGGALGAATGPAAPVAAPIGAAVGSVTGQHIAEEIYDDHADQICRKIGATKAWIGERDAAIARRWAGC